MRYSRSCCLEAGANNYKEILVMKAGRYDGTTLNKAGHIGHHSIGMERILSDVGGWRIW